MDVFIFIFAITIVGLSYSLIDTYLEGRSNSSELEDEVAELTRQFNLMKVQLSDYEDVRKTIARLDKGSFGELPFWFTEGRHS